MISDTVNGAWELLVLLRKEIAIFVIQTDNNHKTLDQVHQALVSVDVGLKNKFESEFIATTINTERI